MQLTRDSSAVHFIRAWEPGRVRVADRWLTGNVIVGSEQILEGWTSIEPHRLTIAELEPALKLEPTIIVLGTGTERLLPDVELMAAVRGALDRARDHEHARGVPNVQRPAAGATARRRRPLQSLALLNRARVSAAR